MVHSPDGVLARVDAPPGWFFHAKKGRLPSPRLISNIIFDQKMNDVSKRKSNPNNELLMSFGQLWIHDANHSPVSDIRKDFPHVKVRI